jgi:chromosome segregation ATPase
LAEQISIPSAGEILSKLPQPDTGSSEESVPAGQVSAALSALEQRVAAMEQEVVRQRREDQLLSSLRLRMNRSANGAQPRALAEMRNEIGRLSEDQGELAQLLQRGMQDIERLERGMEEINERFRRLANESPALDEIEGRLRAQLSSVPALEKRLESFSEQRAFYQDIASRMSQKLDRFQKRLVALEAALSMKDFSTGSPGTDNHADSGSPDERERA